MWTVSEHHAKNATLAIYRKKNWAWIFLFIVTASLTFLIIFLMREDFENRIRRACRAVETDKCRELNIRIYK